MSYVNAPIHDLLIRIKNAYMARKTKVNWVPNKKNINILLKAVENPVNDIPEIKFYSKPSRPWYVSYSDLRVVAWGRGIGIISTNKGLMASHEAKQQKLGGELIAEIY